MPTGVSETRVYNDLLTATLFRMERRFEDQIFDDLPLLSWMNGKLATALRNVPRQKNGVKKSVDGGESIVKEVMVNKNSTVGSYAGAEVIDTTIQDVGTRARYEFKQYSGAIGITGEDRRKNSGPSATANLLQARIDQTMLTLQERLSIGAYSDGTGNGGKDLAGLQAIVSSSSTLAGLAPGTYPTWAAFENSSVGSYAAGGKDAIKVGINTVTIGTMPDAMFTTQDVFQFIEKAEEDKERFVNADALKVGFTSVMIKNIPVFFDRDCPSGTLYILNSRHLFFEVMASADFLVEPFQTPVNQDVSTAKVLWMGAMTTNNRRKLGVLSSITA